MSFNEARGRLEADRSEKRDTAFVEQHSKSIGELKILWNNFTNCGIIHAQDPKTKEVTIDQI